MSKSSTIKSLPTSASEAPKSVSHRSFSLAVNRSSLDAHSRFKTQTQANLKNFFSTFQHPKSPQRQQQQLCAALGASKTRTKGIVSNRKQFSFFFTPWELFSIFFSFPRWQSRKNWNIFRSLSSILNVFCSCFTPTTSFSAFDDEKKNFSLILFLFFNVARWIFLFYWP